MSSYQINPPIYTGECATCGRVQEREICEDCEAKEESRKAPYMAFWAALAVDAELQRSFDHETHAFDSGHVIRYVGGVYKIINRLGVEVTDDYGCFLLSKKEAITWCIENREELI